MKKRFGELTCSVLIFLILLTSLPYGNGILRDSVSDEPQVTGSKDSYSAKFGFDVPENYTTDGNVSIESGVASLTKFFYEEVHDTVDDFQGGSFDGTQAKVPNEIILASQEEVTVFNPHKDGPIISIGLETTGKNATLLHTIDGNSQVLEEGLVASTWSMDLHYNFTGLEPYIENIISIDVIVYGRWEETGGGDGERLKVSVYNWNTFNWQYLPQTIPDDLDTPLRFLYTNNTLPGDETHFVNSTRELRVRFSDENPLDPSPKGTFFLDMLALVVTYTEYDSSGIYTSPIIDAGSKASWTNISWSAEHHMGTQVGFETRTGSGTLTDPIWSQWTGPYTIAVLSAITSGADALLQYRITLTTANTLFTPRVRDIHLNYTKYPTQGILFTPLLQPEEPVSSWGTLSINDELHGQSIGYEYSNDHGGSWNDVPSDGDLKDVPVGSGTLGLKLVFATSDTSITPEVDEISMDFKIIYAPSFILELGGQSGERLPGEEFNLTLYFDNIGNSPSNVLWVNYTAPANISILSHSASWNVNYIVLGSVHSWLYYGVEPGSHSLTVKFEISPYAGDGNRIDNIFELTCADFQNKLLPTVTSNWINLTVTAPQINLTKAVTSTDTTFLGSILYTISYTNEGSSPAYQVIVSDELPKEVQFKSANPPPNSVIGRNVSWSTDYLAPEIGTISIYLEIEVKRGLEITQIENKAFASYKVWPDLPNRTVASNTVVTNIEPENRPRIISSIPDQVVEEDSLPWLLDMTPYGHDNKDRKEDLRWFITGNEKDMYTASGENSTDGVLIFTPLPDAYGSDEVMFWVEDSDGLRSSQKVWINITPVNDRPQITGIDPIFVHFNDPYFLDLAPHVHDVETETLDLIIKIESSYVKAHKIKSSYVKVHGTIVSFTYPETMNGMNDRVTLLVSDGFEETSVELSVSISGNWPPEVSSSLPDITMAEGEVKKGVFELNSNFIDADGDPLTFKASSEHIGVSISSDGIVDLSAPSYWSGQESIIFQAKDPFGAYAEDTIVVTVTPVNDPPTISSLPKLQVHHSYDYIFSLDFYISDPDNSTKELMIWTTDPDHIKVISEDVSLVINYPVAFNGKRMQKKLYVSDGIDVVWTDLDILVTDNFPPTISSPLEDISFIEDTVKKNAMDLRSHFEDTEDPTLTFEAFSSKVYINISYGGLVSVSGPQNWDEVDRVNFRAKDGQGAIVETTISVWAIPVNDPPWILDLPNITINEGEIFLVDTKPYLYDIDNETADLQVWVDKLSNIPIHDNVIFFPGNRTLDGTQTIVVSDGINLSTKEIQVSIILTPVPDSGNEDTMASFIVFAVALLVFFLIILAYIARRSYVGNYSVKEVFLIYQDGILMAHVAKDESSTGMDDDSVGAMLTAIQTFVRDTFSDGKKEAEEAWSLKKLEFAGKNLLIERGEKSFLVVIFDGEEGRRLYKDLENTMDEILDKYGKVLKKWRGNMSQIQGVEQIISRLLTEEDDKEAKEQEVDDETPKDIPKATVLHGIPSSQSIPRAIETQLNSNEKD